jgi:hypothetical protein
MPLCSLAPLLSLRSATRITTVRFPTWPVHICVVPIELFENLPALPLKPIPTQQDEVSRTLIEHG